MKRSHKIGQTIKFFRQLNNINQDTLAVGICTTSYLSRIENSLVDVDESYFISLFKKFNIDFNLLKEEKENEIFRC